MFLILLYLKSSQYEKLVHTCYVLTHNMQKLFATFDTCAVTSQSRKKHKKRKRKEKVMVRFYLDHMRPPTPFNPHHSSHKYLYSLLPTIPFLSFVFFLFLTNTPSHSPTDTSMPPSPSSFFR